MFKDWLRQLYFPAISSDRWWNKRSLSVSLLFMASCWWQWCAVMLNYLQRDFRSIDNQQTTIWIPQHNPKNNNLKPPDQGSGTPQCSCLPVTKQHLSETSLRANSCLTHAHTETPQFYLLVTQASFPPQLTLWEAVIVCWLGICSGVIAFRQLRPFQKSLTLIQGSVEGVNQLGKQYEGHRAERPARVFSYSIIFQIYGCATSSTVILVLGVHSKSALATYLAYTSHRI